MAKWVIENTTLVNIADAIREKTGIVGTIEVTDLATEISHISGEAGISIKATWKNTNSASAYGEIVLIATSAQYSGNYDIMWADANGAMSNYARICQMTIDVASGKVMDSISLMEYNAIPKYATKIVAVKNNEIACEYIIPNNKLWDANTFGEHLYSFGALSDVHIQYETGNNDVRVAMEYLNDRESVEAICVAGDLTSQGTTANLEEWKTARDTYSDNTPVYSCVGNHEAYNSLSIMMTNPNNIRKYLDTDWTTETASSFVKVINNDVFVFMSIFKDTIQNEKNTMFKSEDLAWLEGTLEQYRNQRVFLFAHVPPHWNTNGIAYNGFGTGNGAYSFEIWGNPQVKQRPLADRTDFLNLLDHYKNVIWFNGHSHIKYEYQRIWKNLNIMQYKGGARFVHISSLTVPRDIVDGSVSDNVYAESEGAVVDVYANYIRMRCRNFVGGKFYGMCEYLINTTPVTIPPSSKTVVSISASKVKTSYYTDETLSTSDIIVVATYSDNTTADVSSDCVFNTSQVDISTAGTYTIGVSYTYGNDTVTTSVQVTSVERPATKVLSSISATKTTTSYTVGDTLSTADIVVTATYSDTTTEIVTSSATIDTSQVDMTTEGVYNINISYTEDGVTATTTIIITVTNASVNPAVIMDFSITQTLSSAGAYVTHDNVTVNDNNGTVANISNHANMYRHITDHVGKNLYIRWLSNEGVAPQVGLILCADSSLNGTSSSRIQATDYAYTSTDWTLITQNDGITPLRATSGLSYIVARFKASSSYSGELPITVNARFQIGYVD